jgi:hypothetical protein
MASREKGRQDLTAEFEAREAGVADLFQLYARLESVYAAASKALEENIASMASNSANQTHRANMG